MQKNENSLQPDNLQEIAAAQLSNPQAGEGKEDEFIMLPWQNNTGCSKAVAGLWCWIPPVRAGSR